MLDSSEKDLDNFMSDLVTSLSLVLVSSRALSVVWTTPLVATLGMSLTIPLAMVADMVVHGRHFSAIYILGCIQVVYFNGTPYYSYKLVRLCWIVYLCWVLQNERKRK